MHPRIKSYIDINLNDKDLKRLKKGNTVHKVLGGQNYALHMKHKDWRVQKRILKLQQKIKELQERR